MGGRGVDHPDLRIHQWNLLILLMHVRSMIILEVFILESQ